MAQARLKNREAERARAAEIVRRLKRDYPDAHCSLTFSSAFELLAATILSAQCTDERVNQVTPVLFARYPTPEALALAVPAQVEAIVRSTGFFRAKARSLIGMAQGLVARHDGQVPQDLDALVALPGVGRKTANVVLGNAFGIPGMVVDTHVGRITRRLGLTRHRDPVKVEFALRERVEQEDWVIFSHLLIAHGRAVCSARTRPGCARCGLEPLCPRVGVKREL